MKMHCVVSIPQLIGETSPGVISLCRVRANKELPRARALPRAKPCVGGGGTHDDERRGKGLDAKRGR